MLDQETLTNLEKLYTDVCDAITKEAYLRQEIRKFEQGFRYKKEDMDLGEMSLKKHMENHPDSFDMDDEGNFFEESNFDKGRVIGRIEMKVYKLLEYVGKAKKERNPPDLYIKIDTMYEELQDIAGDFEHL
jgi:hypothetical protein